jgi:2-oxoisovalerate dehydrogenase E2 component (dihydrolipoyl transacylase)
MPKSLPGMLPGDAVIKDQLIVEVMTDKAAVEVPAPVSGRRIDHRRAGDKVAVGSPLGMFEWARARGACAGCAARDGRARVAATTTPPAVTAPAEYPQGAKTGPWRRRRPATGA